MNNAQLLAWLDTCLKAGWIRAIDRGLAALLMRQGCSPQVSLLASLASHQVGRGHTCLSVSRLAEGPEYYMELPPATWRPSSEIETPEHIETILNLAFIHTPQSLLLDQVISVISNSDAVQVLGQHPDQLQPLVYDPKQQLLFLRRYWQHEKNIRAWLLQRMSSNQKLSTTPDFVQSVISSLIPKHDDSNNKEPSWQRIACANAVKHSFSVITGGPGTGKTYTVVRVLSTLLKLQPDLKIALAAPTGKAAARMQESIDNALATDKLPEFDLLNAQLTQKASTIHRLLGAQRGTRYFRHHQTHPLPFDVVVIDEASMIDTEMFDYLLNAIGENTKLVLLGDKDQLAPVETGSILSSIGQGADQGGYSPEHLQWLEAASGEQIPIHYQSEAPQATRMNHIVMLRESRRFSGVIRDLAVAVNQCDVYEANAQLEQLDSIPELRKRMPEVEDVLPRLVSGFCDFQNACQQRELATQPDAWATKVLSSFGHYQILTALRSGPWGQRSLNTLITQTLGGKPDKWYHGRPVMVTSNDYSLNLNNGDIGVALKHPSDGLLKVAFPGKEKDSIRWVLPSRLMDVETVYAMTVHKSQGSEFKHTVLVLPERGSPVVTKELIYTGITRAKEKLTMVVPNKKVWEQAVQTKIERLGGLFGEFKD